RVGADAIHPGYGFLSENASFAQACLQAGLVFVGPRPTAIEAMASKLGARAIAEAAGAPVLVAGSVEASDGIPLPVLVQASAGGGGRGMRLGDSAAALGEAVVSARREAAAAFGDDTLFLEQYWSGARHIEVQVLGDLHGNLVHLFERECSIQRRHQKV